MKQRFLMWGLASIVFLVTLAVSARQEGLWPTDETATRGNRPTVLASVDVASTDPMPLPARPFGPINPAPAVATPVVAAAIPAQQQQPPPPPPPQAVQQTETSVPDAAAPPPMPTAEAEVDTNEFRSHQDRASQHSARSR
jgi:hypothetical protein